MGTSDTPLYDLIELQGLLSNTTYTVGPGGGGDILGTVDNATYSDTDSSNSSTQINELNETWGGASGVLTIDGVDYNIQLVTPSSDFSPVTVTYDGGASTVDLTGDSYSSDVAFIVAEPLGGGSTRWFMAVDDSVGDLPDITSIETRSLDWNPAGDDVYINLDQNNSVFVCYAAGTLIETDTGPRPVEQIRPGDRVLTLDHGPRPVLWTNARRTDFRAGSRPDRQRPIRIRRGALGAGMPMRDLVVSPQHRVLLDSAIAMRLFGSREVLVPAAKLDGLPGISRDTASSSVTYVHFFLGSHEIVLADGAAAESLLPDRMALRALPRAARDDLAALAGDFVAPARPIIDTGPMVRELLRRHRKNRKPLCAAGLADRMKRADSQHPPLRLVSAQ